MQEMFIEEVQCKKTEEKFSDYQSDDFISQFFGPCIEIEEADTDKKQEKQMSSNLINFQIKSEKEKQYCSGTNEEESKKVKRSSYHNFQKHLIITIKRNVNIISSQNGSSAEKAAEEMWKIFKNLKIQTKQSLWLLIDCSSLIRKQQKLKKYGFEQCFSQYSKEDIFSAQNHIKQRIIETFHQEKSQRIIYDRRIQKKEEFIRYFYTVLESFEKNIFSKRIPKASLKIREQQIFHPFQE